ncbi:MAG: phage holin family protein [Eubacteriales bacterium]|nr:phage holin family protein [Eubacteriales bacterium]
MDVGIVGVAGITVISYLCAETAKATTIDNKWLPVICGVVGAGLGVAGMYVMPDFPAKDVINATAVGIVSGLAATGVNQIKKQLTK